ncbi:WecB/TagA/CpsF family glycosyltransferase [bacterium]|nr:WecB/TagA/CpsF family glycosyltransferase [bacterium]
MNQVNICGVAIHNFTMNEALVRIERFVLARQPVSVVTPNVDHIVKLQSDASFCGIYARSALVLADGVPLLWASKFLGTPLKEKLSGSDLFPKLCKVAAQKEWHVFFLGGRPSTAAKSAEVLKARYPKLMVSGTYSPDFGFEKDPIHNNKIIQMIQDAKPDILFIGLGTPKQENWADKYKDICKVPVLIGIGASFEFVAGMVKRAPVWMQKAGWEWFWRLMMEPGRLWKRYLVDDMQFFWLVLKQKFGKL